MSTIHVILLALFILIIFGEELLIMIFFFSFLSLPPSWFEIFPSAPCAQVPLVYVLAIRITSDLHNEEFVCVQ
jgi:hypothetical protein